MHEKLLLQSLLKLPVGSGIAVKPTAGLDWTSAYDTYQFPTWLAQNRIQDIRISVWSNYFWEQNMEILEQLEGLPFYRKVISVMEISFLVNSLWPSDAIRRQGTESTLAQVMMAPSQCLNQCWLIIRKVLWHSWKGIIMRRSEYTNRWNKIESCIFRITFRSLRGQWVKQLLYDKMIP